MKAEQLKGPEAILSELADRYQALLQEPQGVMAHD